MITREDMQVLLGVAEWTMQSRRHVMSTIRELAGTEERYLIIARELDRVNSYDWKCAYCQEKPFEVLYHPIPLHKGGTTVSNCLPVCRGCCTRRKKRAPDQAPLVTTPEERWS